MVIFLARYKYKGERMSLFGIIILSIGLGMDAFAVSICKGVSLKKNDLKKSIIVASYMGIFQALMPVIGYFLGMSFADKINSIDHWLTFSLLVIIGIKMIKDSLETEKEIVNDKVDFKEMIILAIATSIDALAVGITFAFLNVNLYIAIGFIGIITFILCFLGTKIGSIFGDKYEDKAELTGGVILILLGIKIVLEHLKIL